MAQLLTKEIVGPIVIVLISIAFYITFKNIVTGIFLKKAQKKSNKKALTMITVTTNIVKYTLFTIDLLMILDVWGVDTKALLTSIGVLGVVGGLALQDLLKDIISGTAILTEEQFQVGDNIQIGDFRGDVISLGLKTTKVRAYTGEVKIIANRNITEVVNYSIRNSKCVVDLATSYEDDIDKVKKALENVCDKLSKEVNYVVGKVQLLGVQELADSSVNFRIVADTKATYDIPFKRLLFEEVVREFKVSGLTIPYPQVEVHNEK